ncbi:MAG: Helix-turn-helix protein [uncultured Sulfurovum sp.]|uniref:Helix-turn-helix protein n=1 Tax=uncultured Sulfurovum sp. TaxID=269237 RepID=A0A6S6U6F9_9BACT|nr:MAG: Helix-turn-helix protein [uncultured Sulfurovum sp.]
MSDYKNLLESDEYWITSIQTQLFESIDDYINKKKLTKTAFAKEIGVSKGYVTQVLNGDFDHKISTFVRFIRAVGKVPELNLLDFDDYINDKQNQWEQQQVDKEEKFQITELTESNNIVNSLLIIENRFNKEKISDLNISYKIEYS